MSLDPEKAESIPRKLIGMYSDTELSLLGMMADAISKGVDDDDWYARQQSEALRFRNAAQRLAAGLSKAAPTVVGEAVTNAVTFGKEAVEEDIDMAGHLAAKSGRPAGLQANLSLESTAAAKLTRKAVADGVGTLATVNQALPGAASKLYQQVTAHVDATPVSSDLTRRQAVQQALDVLTARGITGFRDNAGRNWSLSTYVEMKSRTLVNNTLREAHVQEALARGHDLLVVSSHPRPAPQCQPYEGQVLTIGPNATDADTLRPNATGGKAVKVKVKATLDDARSKGLFHPNCKHATSIFIPGASRTFTTDPDPEGYKATQQLRQMERAIRDTKRRQAVAIDPSVKKQLGATLRSQQSTLKQHVDAHDLKRRSLRERPDLGYRINPPDALDSVADVPTPKPGPDLGEYLAAEAKYKQDVTDWLAAEKTHNAKPRTLTETAGRALGADVWKGYAETLDLDDVFAVRTYTGNSYEPINEYLRGITDRIEPHHQDAVDRLDKVIDRAPRVPESITVSRAVGANVYGLTKDTDPRSLTGRSFTDGGYLSTALQSALKAVNRDEVELRLDVPAGTRGIYVSSHSRGHASSLAVYGPMENELLLARGIEYEVTGAFIENGRQVLLARLTNQRSDGG
ncbi:hypothetical protein CH304_00275 [Rhodococcus sp. 15-649-1-2]|nr:phage minor capsid protein [Rhodococcus sp. 15-649-1-2]OZE88040.1 hypothetical protein CH304_00275 [Rhodococcus sp. 15-649-1-2]